ncbi:hypothetical protein FQZ97_1207020 [compost metagenome]
MAVTVFSTSSQVDSICNRALEAPLVAAEALEAISCAAAPNCSIAAATLVV